MAKKPPPSEAATLPAVGDSPILRHSTRAAASAIASPVAVAAAAAAPIALASAAPPSSSDTDDAAAALLAKPKPGSTGKKSAKGKAPDGAGNTVPPTKNARTIAAMAPSPPSSDSDESAAPLAKQTKPGGTGKKPSKRKGNDAKNTAAVQAKKAPPAKKAKTTTQKVCPLTL
jgi:hypothetical protein